MRPLYFIFFLFALGWIHLTFARGAGFHVGANTHALAGHRHRRTGEHAAYDSGPVGLAAIETQCSQAGISVHCDFDKPFNGVVYSKGNYGRRSCTFVLPGGGATRYSFVIPEGDCGTVPGAGGSLSNILIFQVDPKIQSEGDEARNVTCSVDGKQTQRFQDKTLIFEPLEVSSPEERPAPKVTDLDVDCDMDILKGPCNDTQPLPEGGKVEPGEDLCISIYLKNDPQYDVTVKDCWVYASDDFKNPNTDKIQLTDVDGCVKRPDLIGDFERTGPGDEGSPARASAPLKAFKFPDSDAVHLACNVRVCEFQCEETCASNSGLVTPPPSRPGTTTTTLRPTTTYRPTTTTTRRPFAFTTTTTTRRPVPTTTAPSRRPYVPTPPPPPTTTTTRKPPTQWDCAPGAPGQDTRCSLTGGTFVDEDEEDIQAGGFTTTTRRTYGPTTTTLKPPLLYDDGYTYQKPKIPFGYPSEDTTTGGGTGAGTYAVASINRGTQVKWPPISRATTRTRAQAPRGAGAGEEDPRRYSRFEPKKIGTQTKYF